MKELKYCCEEFKWRVSLRKEEHPNIRIIKTTDLRYGKEFNSRLRFAITEGYNEKYLFNSLLMIIEYCPFCGKKLSRFYKDNAYANEIEGVTFDY